MSSLVVPEGPRSFTITPDDHGGIIVVVGCILMTWTLLCFMIRLYNRFMLRSALGLDDFACGVATAVGIAQTLVMCVAVSHGFGKSLVLVSIDKLHLAEKDMYAVSMLSLCAVASSKAATLFFHLRITPHRSHKFACYALVGLCTLWMVAVMALIGTRCGSHKPQILYGRTCHNFSKLWVGIAVTDSVLELAIFAVPIWILWEVHTQRAYKVMILMAFASRLLIPVLASIHASTAAEWASTEPAFEPVSAVVVFLWLNVETNYAIMAATFPTLGSFVKSLNTRWGALDGPEVAQYAMESLSERSQNEGRASRGRQRLTMCRAAHEDAATLRPEGSTYSFRMRSPPASASREAGTSRTRTQGSDASDQMIIRKTVDTSVETGYPQG